MRSADFGNRFGMGDAPVAAGSGGGAEGAISKALTDKATKSISEGGSGGCGGDSCGKSAAASNAAQKSLGPPAQPVSAAQLAAICSDMSPAGQANCKAAQAKNAQVEQQNAQRKAIIEGFVKSAIGGTVTDPEQLKLGDETLKLYDALVKKYGDEVKYMTLNQVVQKYPDDAQAMVMSLARQFPGLVGKDFNTVWNTIAPTFKDMKMIDLAASIPNSSWKDVPASAGLSTATKVGGGIGLFVLAAGAAYVLFGRKKNVQAQQ